MWGRPQCYDYEYERCGLYNVFMATEHKTKLDWFYFIKEIAEHYEEAEEVAQVINNLNTHKAGSLYEAFTAEEAKQTHSGSFRVRLHA